MPIQPNYQPLVKPAALRLRRQLEARDRATITTDPGGRGSPEWWRDRLLEFLLLRRTQTDVYEAYYEGSHRLAFATSPFREAFGSLFHAFADNWCDLVVDASVERIGVEGFRFGKDAPADDAAWEIWQRNGLDAESHLAHTEAVKLGVAYIVVGPDPDDGTAAIQVEHPNNAIVEIDPSNPRERRAGLRYWCDPVEGVDYVVLYLPDRVYWWERDTPVATLPTSPTSPLGGTGWEPSEGTGRNPYGIIPIIPIVNKQRLRDRHGTSDLARVIPMQDAINKLFLDMIIASEFAAFRQRYASGIEIPRDENGNVISTFKSGVERLWAVESDTVKWGEFSASDLSNYVTAIETAVQHVAAQTRTPPHYLLGSSGNFPSGESLKATETGLVAKVKSKFRPFGEAWEDAMRLAFLIEGDERRSNAMDAETLWRNPESRSEAEITDAAVKRKSIGIPDEMNWEYIGMSPQAIARAKVMREEEAKLAALAAPPTLPPGDPAAQPGGATPPPQPGDPAPPQ